jgi:hypothetical protein
VIRQSKSADAGILQINQVIQFGKEWRRQEVCLTMLLADRPVSDRKIKL